MIAKDLTLCPCQSGIGVLGGDQQRRVLSGSGVQASPNSHCNKVLSMSCRTAQMIHASFNKLRGQHLEGGDVGIGHGVNEDAGSITL
jgi:ribosomal protein S5|eukprot:m.86670 g.86670  ORF g.86670 m.86670 type:complete len:87 (+) comp19855_c1_seq8:1358-1618(+)